ncbi:ubinuclein-1 isoform X3 [Typha angustifolia]|uniref:ubinuclein-1 isoform X3 n=1 Tax=Typha angustifolia TaxID=59011 RepID=UPI003C2F8ACC
MEEDISKAPSAAARVSPAVSQSTSRPPPPPSSSSNPPMDEHPAAAPPVPAAGSRRQRFSVELRAGETTIVSWKKLLKESSHGGGSPSQPRGAEADIGPAVGPSGSVKPEEDDLNEEVPPSNRFSAVIEKIERLYMGKQSSDEEELDDVPDDDQYDTEDSFIDDAELDEYFQVDKLATKHNGYFVNKGKLEQISEPSSSPNVAPKKRRRKETTKSHREKDLGHAAAEQLNVGDMRVKAAPRSGSFMGKKLSRKIQAPHGAHYYEESKHVKNKANAHTGAYEKKSADFPLNTENPIYAKVSNKDAASLPSEPKDFDKHKAGAAHSRDIAYTSRTSESYDYTYSVSRDKSASSQLDFQSKKLLNSENVDVPTKIRRKEKYGAGEYADTSISGSIYPMQAVSTLAGVREGASIRPKGTTLERAIRDLEKIVAEFRPPSLDAQEVDPACQVKRRLPQEVKQKLAKVARLSASQGKISEDELIDRLMGILGHLVQRKTLKRNMKEMVELGLSAKQQKAGRFQQIKGEINEMIRSRISYIKSKATEQQDGSAESFQEVASNDERRSLKGKYSMDSALEDKICDLYDLYVEGMDEDKGPQSRKLYVELAELWPHGYMDNVGIKDAIYRSKERRRALYRRHKVRDAERIKRKRLASAVKVEDSNQAAQVRAAHERPVIDYSGQVIVSPDKLITNQPLASIGKVVDPSPPLNDSAQYQGSKNIDKVKAGNSITAPDEGNRNAVDVKKKMKRKSESDLGEIQVHPAKIPSQHTMERQKSHKHTDETNASSEPKSSIQVSGLPSSDKSS